MSIGALLGRFRGRAAGASGAAAGAASRAATSAASNPSIFGKVGKFLKGNALNAAFFVAPALLAYGYKYNASAEEVKGINWSSGNKAVGKGIAKMLGFSVSGAATAAIACGITGTLGPIVAALGLYFGFTKVPEVLEKLLPDEGEQVKKACEAKGISYTPPSLLGSITGGGVRL